MQSLQISQNLIGHFANASMNSQRRQWLDCGILFTRQFPDNISKPRSRLQNSPKTKHEEVAVNMLDAVSRKAWSMSKEPFIIAPTPIEKTDTINAATVACTCTKAMFPTIMCTTSFAECMLPRLAWVESLDASVMSKLPFNPNSAGTRMKSSGMCWKTSQCCEMNRVKVSQKFSVKVVNLISLQTLSHTSWLSGSQKIKVESSVFTTNDFLLSVQTAINYQLNQHQTQVIYRRLNRHKVLRWIVVEWTSVVVERELSAIKFAWLAMRTRC